MEQEKRKITAQKLKKVYPSSIDIAIRYYSILSAINDLHLTEREIQLVAFTALKGNISYSTNREEFCSTYKSSGPTINNMISKLKKTGLLVKDSGKIKVNPAILLPFENDVVLQLNLLHG